MDVKVKRGKVFNFFLSIKKKKKGGRFSTLKYLTVEIIKAFSVTGERPSSFLFFNFFSDMSESVGIVVRVQGHHRFSFSIFFLKSYLSAKVCKFLESFRKWVFQKSKSDFGTLRDLVEFFKKKKKKSQSQNCNIFLSEMYVQT